MPLSRAGIPARVPPLCGEPRWEKRGRRLKGCQAEELDGLAGRGTQACQGAAPAVRARQREPPPGQVSRSPSLEPPGRDLARTWLFPPILCQGRSKAVVMSPNHRAGTGRAWPLPSITGQGWGGVVPSSNHRARMGRVWSLPPITGLGWGGCGLFLQSQGRDKGRDWSLHLSRGRTGSGPCLHFPNPH